MSEEPSKTGSALPAFLASLPKYDPPDFRGAIASLPKFDTPDFSGVIRALQSLPSMDLGVIKPSIDFNSIFHDDVFLETLKKIRLDPLIGINGIASTSFASAVDNIGNIDFSEQDRQQREAMLVLSGYGWFISLDETPLKLTRATATLFNDEKHNDADLKLCSHFQNALQRIEESITSAFPNRKNILSKIFEAHRNGNYELSIPALLAQAEGMGFEMFGASVYSKKPSHIKKIREQFDSQIEDDFALDYSGIVTSPLIIKADTKELAQYNTPLNRHAILHGLSVDYATGINAFKSISWLQFIASFKTAADFLFARKPQTDT
jgi:hypothetical protein